MVTSKIFSKGKKAFIRHSASGKNKELINPGLSALLILLRNIKRELPKMCPAAIWTPVENLMKTSPSLNF